MLKLDRTRIVAHEKKTILHKCTDTATQSAHITES